MEVEDGLRMDKDLFPDRRRLWRWEAWAMRKEEARTQEVYNWRGESSVKEALVQAEKRKGQLRWVDTLCFATNPASSLVGLMVSFGIQTGHVPLETTIFSIYAYSFFLIWMMGESARSVATGGLQGRLNALQDILAKSQKPFFFR